MRWIVLLSVILLVASAFAMALRILNRRDDESDDEVREIVLSRALLREQAASLWGRWRDRLWRGRPSPEGPFLSLEGEGGSRRRVRAAYQAFLAAMIAHDHPRQRRHTPFRYAKFAAQHVADRTGAVDELTRRYVAARYDFAEPTQDDAVAAENAWADIREHLAGLEQANRSRRNTGRG